MTYVCDAAVFKSGKALVGRRSAPLIHSSSARYGRGLRRLLLSCVSQRALEIGSGNLKEFLSYAQEWWNIYYFTDNGDILDVHCGLARRTFPCLLSWRGGLLKVLVSVVSASLQCFSGDAPLLLSDGRAGHRSGAACSTDHWEFQVSPITQDRS